MIGRDRRPGLSSSGLVDRRPQNLPVPLGGMAPEHDLRRVSSLQVIWRRWWHHLAITAGIVCAVLAALLVALAPPGLVYERAGAVHVDQVVLSSAGRLPETGATLFTGAASYLLVERPDGSARASAVSTGSSHLRATCELRSQPQLLTEHCRFNVDSRTFSADDVLDLRTGSGWRRAYSDGRHVAIGVPPEGAVVPVPFPIGH